MDALHAHRSISKPSHSRHHQRHSPRSARPMSIRGSRQEPPPPLPPPRHVQTYNSSQASAWRYWSSDLASPRELVRSGSSLAPASSSGSRDYSGPSSPLHSRHHSVITREGPWIASAPSDPPMTAIESGEQHSYEDMRSDQRRSLANFRFQSESNLGRKEVYKGAQAYDRNLLSRISGSNAASANSRFPGQLKPLLVPDGRPSSGDSPPSRWQRAPSAGVSPSGVFRTPWLDQIMADVGLPARMNVTTPEASEGAVSSHRSHRNSDDQSMHLDPGLTKMDVQYASGKHPYYDGEVEHVEAAGVSSPRSDEGHAQEDRILAAGDNMNQRRSVQMLASKISPGDARTGNCGASLSSSASLGVRYGSSYASTWNPSGASSLTSYSGEQLSPRPRSPAAEAEFGTGSSHGSTQVCNRSPQKTMSQATQSSSKSSDTDATPDSDLIDVVRNEAQALQAPIAKVSTPKAWDGYPHICQCCPKRPKRFDNEMELRMHELEKQYQCAYCPNRFKNKNEAERHQNSLHLRRQSWSCAALANISKAFCSSSIHPTTFDICGYCGEEFPIPANWSLRSEHLLQRHKFGECNRAKKFYRADHFRQHLRHSHAGTSGKWTNALESACMREEPTPPPMPPRNLMAPVAPPTVGIHPHTSSVPSGFVGPGGPYPEVIDEECTES